MTSETAEDRPAEKQKRQLPMWLETIVLLGLAILVAVVLKTFFVQTFYIPSKSMEPGLENNDRILVERMSYWGGGTPSRGDVVVFKDPGHWLTAEDDAGPANPIGQVMAKIGLYPAGGHLVKRVIGVAGDTIHCCDKQGRISVNGVALNEKAYVNELPGMRCNGVEISSCKWTAGPVPPGHLFVMGDNRSDSADSVYHLCPGGTYCHQGSPYVPTSDVVGKVVALLWPFGRAHILHRPADFAAIPPAK